VLTVFFVNKQENISTGTNYENGLVRWLTAALEPAALFGCEVKLSG